LGRAKETAHHCLWAFLEQPLATQPKKYVLDYRLNERHYGSLQGFVKCDVENEIYGHDSQMVKQWRRNWHAIPPVLDNDDPRWIEEIRKYGNFCGGADNVPRGESLEMVATNRIRPFLDEVLNPIMEEAAQRKRKCILNDDSKNYSSIDTDRRDDYELGGTGLVIAHANSLRALIGVICQVEKDDNALKKLEATMIVQEVVIQNSKKLICSLLFYLCNLAISIARYVFSQIFVDLSMIYYLLITYFDLVN